MGLFDGIKGLFSRQTKEKLESVEINGMTTTEVVEVETNPLLEFLDNILDAAENFAASTPGDADDKFVAWLRGLYDWLEDNLEALQRAADFAAWIGKNKLFTWIAKRASKL